MNNKEEALETVVLSKLEIRKIHTVGLDGLADYGFTSEELKLLKKIITEEKRKARKNRSALNVITIFKSQIKKQKRGLNPSVSSQDARDARQKFQLGIPFEDTHWFSVDAGGKKYYVVCSVTKKGNPDPQNAKWLFRIKNKNKFTANVILAVKVDNDGKVMSAIILTREMKGKTISIVRSVHNLLSEKDAGHWIKDENKASLICIRGSNYTYTDVVGIIENCIKSICA